MAYIGEMQYLTIGNNTYSLPTGGGGDGTVTSVGVANATNGGLSISGSPITTTGTISIGHSNVLSSAQTTQAVYPIKIDKNGHISAYGNAVTIPTATNSATTGITATTTATKTTLGTAGSVYGVKSGTNSTTTASKASGSNGSASTWTFEEKTIPNVTAAGSGSFTSTVTNHVLSFSHTHTAPTIETAIKVQSKSGGGNGTAPTWSFTDVTVPIRADSATSVPNVSVASATVSISDSGHTHSI